MSYCSELRTVTMHKICHKCGKTAAPQMLRAIFYRSDDPGKPSWYVVGWEHIKCEPPGPCETCHFRSLGGVCHQEKSIFYRHWPIPNTKGCQHWEVGPAWKKPFCWSIIHYADGIMGYCKITGAVEPLYIRGKTPDEVGGLLARRLAEMGVELPDREFHLDRTGETCPY